MGFPRDWMAAEDRRLVDKVFVYLTRGHHLLLMSHPDHPEAGIQVPGGTVKPGETSAEAAARELEEETGLLGFLICAHLGTTLFDMTPFGRDQIQRRSFFHAVLHGSAQQRWIHYESEGGPVPIRLEFFWHPLDRALPELIAGHGAMLDELNEALRGGSDKS